MNSKLTKLALTATLGLALAFTISCGEHSWGENHLLDNSGDGGDYSSSSFSYNGSYDGSNPFLHKTINVGYNTSNAADITSREYLKYASQRSSISTFVNQDGTVTVCVLDDNAKIAHIYEFSMTLELQRQLSFPYEFDIFGAFTKDSEGNYYFFYAKEAAELYQKDAGNEPENMVMVKYDGSGRKIKTYTRKPKVGTDSGIQLPFRSGNCRLEISGSMLAVYFSRRMFKGEDGVAHQSSYGFVLNKDTFEEVPVAKPYASHSFNQFILPINNGFVFADHGDAYPRAFKFSRVDNNNIKSLNSFTFTGSTGDNTTNAQMGGLAKTSGGYIFAGTYGESPDKRNLFILTFDDAMTAISNPRYITTYAASDNRSIGQPKIVGIGSGQYLLLWELYGTVQGKYLSTQMQIIDETGNPLSPVKDLQGLLRLNMGDFLRYNRQNGRVYWAINDRDMANSFTVYALETQYAYANDNFLFLPDGNTLHDIREGTFTDSRDEKTYKTVEIGNQTWMAENLNYNADGSKCYANDENNCLKYGRLYNWETAKSSCPSGWHLSGDKEWETLIDIVGGLLTAGRILKSKSGWEKDGIGIDAIGFSALPGGYGESDGGFFYVGESGLWWSSDSYGSKNAYCFGMYSTDVARSGSRSDKSNLRSVRCLQD
ncbi:MAG: fibrobacter succinogenes major paralogous domain-containing protein [Fibromonadaceae bacterium]|jgi:uncharacterized protein (TIGR02145 family)|nr:fibrobacter succinogenes major paralogous domain-containing protein [Fibromonadaceae bacterium]